MIVVAISRGKRSAANKQNTTPENKMGDYYIRFGGAIFRPISP
jgi:hypothetical protein